MRVYVQEQGASEPRPIEIVCSDSLRHTITKHCEFLYGHGEYECKVKTYDRFIPDITKSFIHYGIAEGATVQISFTDILVEIIDVVNDRRYFILANPTETINEIINRYQIEKDVVRTKYIIIDGQLVDTSRKAITYGLRTGDRILLNNKANLQMNMGVNGSRETFTIDCLPGETVKDVKTKFGYDCKFRLQDKYFTKLGNDAILAKYFMHTSALLANFEDIDIISVNIVTREEIPMRVWPPATIQEVLQQYKLQTGSALEHSVIYSGEVLDKGRSLLSYRIRAYAILHFHHRDDRAKGSAVFECTELPKGAGGSGQEGASQPRAKRRKTDPLEQYCDNVIANINKGTVLAPPAISAIQFMKSKKRVYIYCDADKLGIGTKFAKEHFDDESNFVVFPTTATEYLSHCAYCRRYECPSKTGHQKDISCKTWVGPGSTILAVKSTMWRKIKATGMQLHSLNAVRSQHDEILRRERDDSIKFIAEWTLACHVICDDSKHAALTVAHPLKDSNLENGTKLTFLTQVHIPNNLIESPVKVLGESYRGRFLDSQAIDVLIIDINRPNTLGLIQTKMKHPCKDTYIDIEPKFKSVPTLGTPVSKRGRASGNTYGKIITEDKFYILQHPGHGFNQQKAVDAFAVSSTETQREEKTDFAIGGDSGGLVLECKSSLGKDVNAFGMVWCKKPVCSAIPGEDDVDPRAVVCVKTNKCLDYVRMFYGLNPETQPLTTHLQVAGAVSNAIRTMNRREAEECVLL